MFGEDSVPKTFTGDRFEVVVDQKLAKIDLATQNVVCEDDQVSFNVNFKQFYIFKYSETQRTHISVPNDDLVHKLTRLI